MTQLPQLEVERLAARLRRADPAQHLDERDLARIASRLASAVPTGRFRPGARVAALIASLLGVPLAFAGASYWVGWKAPSPPPAVVERPAQAPVPSAPVLPAEELAVLPPATAPRPEVRPRREVRQVAIAPPPLPAPAEAPPPAPTASHSLVEESRLLQQALGELQARKGASALAILDRYRVQFPHGMLAQEERLARLDALLALGDKTSALGVLEHLEDQPGTPRAPELRVLRAELSAESGRCAQALALFEQATLEAEDADLVQRARFGRARCLLQVGREGEGREALHQYLRQFPSGRFARQAKAALGP